MTLDVGFGFEQFFDYGIGYGSLAFIAYLLFRELGKKDKEISRLNEEAKSYASDYKAAAKEFTEVLAIIKDRLK